MEQNKLTDEELRKLMPGYSLNKKETNRKKFNKYQKYGKLDSKRSEK